MISLVFRPCLQSEKNHFRRKWFRPRWTHFAFCLLAGFWLLLFQVNIFSHFQWNSRSSSSNLFKFKNKPEYGKQFQEQFCFYLKIQFLFINLHTNRQCFYTIKCQICSKDIFVWIFSWRIVFCRQVITSKTAFFTQDKLIQQKSFSLLSMFTFDYVHNIVY